MVYEMTCLYMWYAFVFAHKSCFRENKEEKMNARSCSRTGWLPGEVYVSSSFPPPPYTPALLLLTWPRNNL